MKLNDIKQNAAEAMYRLQSRKWKKIASERSGKSQQDCFRIKAGEKMPLICNMNSEPHDEADLVMERDEQGKITSIQSKTHGWLILF